MCWGGTRINLKRVNMTTKENNLQKFITFAFLSSSFSFPQLNYVVLSHGNVWSIVMHIHLAEENPLGKLQCTVG